MPTRNCYLAAAIFIAGMATAVHAQFLQHPPTRLMAILPAGGQQGSQVTVELLGDGLPQQECEVVVEGPPGVVVESVESVTFGKLKVTINVAADAPLGPRRLRVQSPQAGLTNWRSFFVGSLPELVESEPNNDVATAQRVSAPLVVNGRIGASLDVDWYSFQAKEGQKLVAAVLAHGMDSIVDLYMFRGYLDANLQLLDEQGATIASSEDAIGLDPLIHVTIPRDGEYKLRVQSLSYRGTEQAVYRLTIGEVPYPTACFPTGGKRGETIKLTWSGPNVPESAASDVTIDLGSGSPVQFAAPPDLSPDGRVLPILRGDLPETVANEPNDDQVSATALELPVAVVGRFDQPGDADWFKLSLQQGEGVLLETVAQRHLGAPVDTELRVFDAGGKELAKNDDGSPFGGSVQCAHDFVASDSWLPFTAPAAGDYFVRVRDLNQAEGPQSVYQLRATAWRPDFTLYQWPDAVPIWGPGGTATFVVEVVRWGGLTSDVEVTIEDLPPGWMGSTACWPAAWYSYVNGNMAVKLVLAITAPAEAKVGERVPFRVVGRAKDGERDIVHEAHYLTLLGNGHNDRMHVRAGSERAWAAVAEPLDFRLETSVTELSGKPGEALSVPVTIHRLPTTDGKQRQLSLVVNGPTPSAGCGWSSPVSVPDTANEFTITFNVSAEYPPGDYWLNVARGWASDLRAGRPGPCTQMFLLRLKPKE